MIGPYRLGFELTPHGNTSKLRVFIDYDLAEKNRWLGRLFGKMYARWCTGRMATDAAKHFEAADTSGSAESSGGRLIANNGKSVALRGVPAAIAFKKFDIQQENVGQAAAQPLPGRRRRCQVALRATSPTEAFTLRECVFSMGNRL